MIPLGILGAASVRVASEVDPHWSSVVSLLHFDGPNLVHDEKGKVWTVTGLPDVYTGEYKFGGASMVALSSMDRIDCIHPDFAFGTGDFTIEGWYRPDRSSNRAVFSFGPRLVYVASNNWAYFTGSNNAIVGGQMPLTIWFHVALTRHLGVVRLFINGLQAGASYPEPGAIDPGSFRIGWYNSGNAAGGLYDEFRTTKGVARYTSNFMPPTAPFPSSGL